MIDLQKIPKNHKVNCQCFICKGVRGERTFSKEYREKLRISSTGRTNKGKKGQKCSDEHKQKVSIALKGNKNSLGVERIFSEKHKIRLKEAKMGDKNPLYKDGKTAKTNNWAQIIKERDNYTCQICGKGNDKLLQKQIHAHHIKPKKDFPELKYDIEYGITLCYKCHRKYEKNPSKLLNIRELKS